MASTGEGTESRCRARRGGTRPLGRARRDHRYSGAGKSEAIAAFEDGGYFCVDNLPPRMIARLGELFRHEGSGVERAAVVSDVRGGEYFDDLAAGARGARGEGLNRTCSSSRPTRRRWSTATRRPAAATRWRRKGGSSMGSARARAAGAAARAGRRGHRHQQPHRRASCAGGSRRVSAPRRAASSRSPCSPSASRTGRRVTPT